MQQRFCMTKGREANPGGVTRKGRNRRDRPVSTKNGRQPRKSVAGFEKVGPLALVLGFGGGAEEGGGAPAGYFRGPGSPAWRRQVLPYRSGEDAPPGKKETGSKKHRRGAN